MLMENLVTKEYRAFWNHEISICPSETLMTYLIKRQFVE